VLGGVFVCVFSLARAVTGLINMGKTSHWLAQIEQPRQKAGKSWNQNRWWGVNQSFEEGSNELKFHFEGILHAQKFESHASEQFRALS
jgi:hypothetical protein